MNRKILMICYYYPPLLDVGARRNLGFAKNLKKLGWLPHVLSVKNPDQSYCILGDEISTEEITVSYVRSIFNSFKFLGQLHGMLNKFLKIFGITMKKNYFREFLCIPDHFHGWIPGAFIAGIYLIRKYKMGVIFVSCKPISAGIAGVLLKKITGKPLVLDFRDPFTVVETRFNQLTRFRRYLLKKTEEWLLRITDIFIVTSNETKNAYIYHYPWIKNKIFTIHNGIDVSNINKSFNFFQKNSKFTIIYAGLYFYTQQEWDPEFFFYAIQQLKNNEIINKENFVFAFYGEGYKNIQAISERLKIKDIVNVYSRTSYQELIPKIKSSHLQLLRTRELAIPAKFFEGIYFNVPFLATIPEGETASLIRKFSPSSYIITEQKPEPVADAIQDAINKYKNNEILDNHVQEFQNEFSREVLTKKLVNILEKL